MNGRGPGRTAPIALQAVTVCPVVHAALNWVVIGLLIGVLVAIAGAVAHAHFGGRS